MECDWLMNRVLGLQSSQLLHFVLVLLLDPEEDLGQIEFPYAEIRFKRLATDSYKHFLAEHYLFAELAECFSFLLIVEFVEIR